MADDNGSLIVKLYAKKMDRLFAESPLNNLLPRIVLPKGFLLDERELRPKGKPIRFERKTEASWGR